MWFQLKDSGFKSKSGFWLGSSPIPWVQVPIWVVWFHLDDIVLCSYTICALLLMIWVFSELETQVFIAVSCPRVLDCKSMNLNLAWKKILLTQHSAHSSLALIQHRKLYYFIFLWIKLIPTLGQYSTVLVGNSLLGFYWRQFLPPLRITQEFRKLMCCWESKYF